MKYGIKVLQSKQRRKYLGHIANIYSFGITYGKDRERRGWQEFESLKEAKKQAKRLNENYNKYFVVSEIEDYEKED